MSTADVVGEVRDLLAQAEFFLRSVDPNGAVTRARKAVGLAIDELGRDAATTQDALVELERFDTAARAWSEEVARRERLRETHQIEDSARYV